MEPKTLETKFYLGDGTVTIKLSITSISIHREGVGVFDEGAVCGAGQTWSNSISRDDLHDALDTLVGEAFNEAMTPTEATP